MPGAKKKSKKKIFSASKAVKANARTLIGTPQPTRLESDKLKRIKRERKHKPTLGDLLETD
jgi:hypothetical protein